MCKGVIIVYGWLIGSEYYHCNSQIYLYHYSLPITDTVKTKK